MKFWQSIVNYLRRERGGTSGAGEPRFGGQPLFPSLSTGALNVATVYRCVKLLSESVANLPIQYQKANGGIFQECGDKRINYLLNVAPDFTVNAFDFWRKVVIEMLLDGNAYIVPVWNPVSMNLDRLVLCSRGTVAHDTVNDLYTVTDLTNAISGTFRNDEIIHLKGLTFGDPKTGVSVLSYARLTTRIASTGDKETHSRFATGGTVRGIVSNGGSVQGFGQYQDEQLEKTAEDIDLRFKRGAHIVSLPGEVGFNPISLNSTDMQFLESRKFTVIEICRFFSVPPTFVYADTSSNYKTVEQADVDFLGHTLNPLLRSIEVELLRKLVAPNLCHKYRFRFDRRELFACDLNGMQDYGIKMLQTGATLNEVRKLNNLEPVEGGDAPLVSANLRTVNELSPKENTENEEV